MTSIMGRAFILKSLRFNRKNKSLFQKFSHISASPQAVFDEIADILQADKQHLGDRFGNSFESEL